MGARPILAISEENARRGSQRWLRVVVGRQIGANFWQRRRVVRKTKREANHRTPGTRDVTHNLHSFRIAKRVNAGEEDDVPRLRHLERILEGASCRGECERAYPVVIAPDRVNEPARTIGDVYGGCDRAGWAVE